MEIIKQISAKEKAFAMIDSCKSEEHFSGTLKYIELYFAKFEDLLGYNELKSYYNKIKNK